MPQRLSATGLVFPGRRGTPIAHTTLSDLLRQLDIGAVPHGFRSLFRNWAAEQTVAPHAVMEAALAHKVTNRVEAAYFRSDLLDKRRELMEQRSAYLSLSADRGGADRALHSVRYAHSVQCADAVPLLREPSTPTPTSSRKVCSFELPTVSSFRLPLTAELETGRRISAPTVGSSPRAQGTQ